MNPLLELADRVEAAKAADRELDRDIMLVAVPCDRAPFRYWMPVNENTGSGCEDVERVYYGPHCAQVVAVPAFSGSLDAAMTLVPENPYSTGERFQVESWTTNGVHAEHIRASAWVSGTRRVFAATPALALTAASLRAIASMGSSG